jgi:membrane fusion protein (multidrug efflux system)
LKIDAISHQAHDESQAAAAQARADMGVARANLETARINLRYSRIEAPIAGRISLSSVTPGALVTANQTTP